MIMINIKKTSFRKGIHLGGSRTTITFRADYFTPILIDYNITLNVDYVTGYIRDIRRAVVRGRKFSLYNSVFSKKQNVKKK